jgi:hypothetical protein
MPLVNIRASNIDQSAAFASIDGLSSGEVCVPNISLRERRKRLAIGVISGVMALGVLAILIVTGASRWSRLPLFFLFIGATSGFFQWRDKT